MAKMASKRTSIDTVETLILTHFTNPPKINFGKIMVGKKKFRTLILRNPHDFEQEVIIERFPFKKKFMVERTRFVVPAEDMVSLEITFSPEEAGGFREMIQFHINDFYRLQAFIIGVVEKPKPPQTFLLLQRKFPMGGRLREPPSVLQTPALSSIKSSYSPKRSEEVREMLEDLDQIINKENSRELVSQDNNYDTKAIVQEHCLKTTEGSSVKVESGAEVRAPKIFRAEEECFKTPTPLESTALTGLHDKGQLSQKNRRQKAIVDETRVIRRDEVTFSPSVAEAEQSKTGVDAVRSRSNFMEANRRDDRSSPNIQKKSLGVCDMVTSPASPGTILNQSLNLISQMKLPKPSDGSPTDPNQSINCSLISLGQGIVSPNSFVEDMRSMRHDISGGSGGSVNTSTPLIPSPLSVLNNSIPHSVMVSHLNKIRSSLNSPHIGGSSGGSTPVKQAALKRCPKRRSITSQFKKEEIKKLAMVAAAMDKHGNGLANSGQVKYLLRKDQIDNKNNVCKAPSPRQALFVKKTKAAEARKLESSKRSPTGKRLNKRSPIAKPFLSKRSPKRVKQEPTMKQVKSKFTTTVVHSGTVVHPATVVHSGTVVKAKSGECLEESIKYFDDLQADPESSANRNSSLTRRGKLFPDIEVSNLSDVVVGEEEIERSMSPQRFCPLSPGDLPTSPGAELEHSRRGTVTVVKSRPSDALLAAMNNRKRLFAESPHRTPAFCINEDDTETQEKIQVRVEEHYEEIDGEMFLVVKETTDVVKSTTETYIEQLVVSPRHFQTPPRLPNSPDPQMTRRSTHVVHSPKVLNVLEMDHRRLDFQEDFIKYRLPGDTEMDDSTNRKGDARHYNVNSSSNTSKLNLEDHSRLKRYVWEDIEGDKSPITSVSLITPKIVDYDVGSDGCSSGDITKDSLETSQTTDSLNQSSAAVSNTDGSNAKSDGPKDSNGEGSEYSTPPPVPVSSNCSCEPVPSISECHHAPEPTTSESFLLPVSYRSGQSIKPDPTPITENISSVARNNSGSTTCEVYSTGTREPLHNAVPITNEESEEENFYDTQKLTLQGNNLEDSRNVDHMMFDKKQDSLLILILINLLSSVPQVNRGNIKQRGPTRGVAQSRLILVKKPKTGAPRHPMPFAARNMYYDERWVEKQERGFVQWLNFVLTPPDEYVAVTTKAKVDAHSLALDNRQVAPRLAPTKEILSFRAYAARRRLNQLRRAACELYQSEPIVNIICKIEVEVESRRLAVRKDKMVHADLGVKQRLLDLLLQYSSLWLRIGLETIFGEVVMLQSNTDVVGLSRFIVTRLLASPDIAAQFAHPTVPHLYKEGYAAALSRHTIKKFLLLVYFLDQAKSSHLIDHDPCLFCKDADIKSSKEILIEFSREVLSGEGDLTRHLAYLGYIVTQSQRSIDEFDFAVKTLSADLRDGLRLSRIIELLAGNKTIMSKLRTPAISLLQKQHNVKQFFEAMAERKMDLSKSQVTPKDIVDGHREKTLLLLWHLIIHFQCSIKVNMDHLKEEIDMLIKSLQLKLAMQKVGVLSKEGCQARRDSGGTQLLMENERLQLIFQWCRLVCLHYGVTVENFTVSFSDGRALCCLIHHYHPALLPLSEIKFHTTVSFQQEAEDQCQVVTDPDSSMDWGHGGGLMANENNPEMFEELLANEKANFKTLYEKVSELGGVPLMLRCADMSNTIPDEKVVSTYVSYMCARLLDIREEVKAARIIQMFWRRRQLKLAVKKRELRTKAAVTIQRWIRLHLAKMSSERREKAAVCLQARWRGYMARREASRLKEHEQIAKLRLQREQAAVKLQYLWRSRCARRQLAKLKKAAVVLQKFVRACRTRREFERKRFAVLTIQAVWRRLNAEKRVQKLRLELHKKSALTIQRWMKRYLCMKRLSSMRAAALVIQKNWRMLQAKKKLYHLKVDQQNKAAILIQKVIRGKILEKQFKKMRNSTLVLQTYWRVKKAKKELARLRNEKTNSAAILIQSVLKRVAAQKLFLKKRRAAIVLQKHWRRAMAKKELDSLKLERNNKYCTIVQSFLKSVIHRQAFLRKKRAAIILQKNWRRTLAKRQLSNNRQGRIAKAATTVQSVMKSISYRKMFLRKRHAATVLQKHWRRALAQQKLSGLKAERLDRAATLVQCALKAFAQRKLFVRKRDSALTLQKNWRRTLAQREAAHLRTLRDTRAALVVQKFWRGWRVKKEFISLKRSAVVVQGAWRVCLAKRERERLVAIRHTECATVIQRTYRSYLHRKEFQKLRSAATVIQKTWRMQLAKRELKRLRGLRQEQAAVTIQRYYRGHRSKK
ncbi:unnamed protein product [Lymnaea stagnalis]|uniref:Calponin-homology (CH) domain-containing protein n=1 Tax=Lymnaea stagnalis TaxID=6523 RepID=A0AAV2HW44_LYMST